jgi:hypothetical protein
MQQLKELLQYDPLPLNDASLLQVLEEESLLEPPH